MTGGSVIEVMGSRSTKYGGVEKFLTKLVTENPSRQFYIIYNEEPRSEDYLTQLKQLGAKVLVIDTRGTSFITNSYRFYKLIRKVKPEIVHFHFSNAYSTWGPICKLMKVKRLYKTVHGCLFVGDKQIYDIHETSIKHRIMTRMGNAYKIFDKIFCVSNFVKNQFDTVYKNRGNTNVIYMGTQSPQIITEADKKEMKQSLGISDQHVILTIAFANPIKGCDVFVKSLSYLKNDNYVALIVGMDENAPFTKEVKELARELKVNAKIRWIGITNEVYKYMNISEIFVQSSRTDALPLAAVEAMSFSMPVIATNTGGLPEVASELFSYEDSKELANSLDKLLSNKEEWKKQSLASYKRWSEVFKFENGVKQYTEYYNM